MLRTDISNEAYHASPELSRSTASALLKTSPAHVKHNMDNPSPKTSALLMGGCFHTAVLEPEKLDYEFGEKPNEIDGNGPRTNAYKEALAEIEAEYPERQWLNSSEYNTCMEMAASCLDHPVVSAYLAEVDSIIEGTGFFQCEGAECKVRPDYFLPGADVVMDLKSTQDASKKGFAKSVRQFGYDFQACFYMEGLRRLGHSPKQFIFVAVEKKPPYNIGVYTLRGADIERHREDMRRACQLWTQCVSNKVWPGYSESVEILDLSNNFNRLSISDIARKFEVSRTYVYKIIEAYQLEVRQMGRKQTIDMADFANAMRWYNENERDVA